MKRHLSATAVLATLLSASTSTPVAGAEPGKPVNPDIDQGMINAGFLNSHPDLRYRMLGLEEHRQGKHEDALHFFQRASYYGDKPSQGMVAEMLWNGTGTPANRPQAYAWMDLAAERGYQGFLLLREQYWSALDEAERAAAIAQGHAIYAEYGDTIAQRRLARLLRQERRRLTGSRTGFAGTLEIAVPGPAGFERLDGSKFYDEKFWDPALYQAWHDSIWAKPRIGEVTIGKLERATETPSKSPLAPAAKPGASAGDPDTPSVDASGAPTPPGD